MGSKYKATWVAGEFNTEFWNEVLVDRRIRTAMYENGRFSVVLDSGETVFFSGTLGWDQLDMIAPAPHGPVGQKITALEWDEVGISALCLQVGRILLDKEVPGRFCIKDDPSEPTVRRDDHADIAALRAIPDSDVIAAADKALARIKGIPAQQIILDEAKTFTERVIAHEDATEEDIRNGYTTPSGHVMLPTDEVGLVDVEFTEDGIDS